MDATDEVKPNNTGVAMIVIGSNMMVDMNDGFMDSFARMASKQHSDINYSRQLFCMVSKIHGQM